MYHQVTETSPQSPLDAGVASWETIQNKESPISIAYTRNIRRIFECHMQLHIPSMLSLFSTRDSSLLFFSFLLFHMHTFQAFQYTILHSSRTKGEST